MADSRAPAASAASPLYGSIKQACTRYGRGKTTIYDWLNSGLVKGKKANRGTLVDFDSGDRYVASLPDYEPAGRKAGG
jgi:hypothetical protein